MEDPVAEIPGLLHLLTQSPPSIQQAALETYFTPRAALTHPLFRTGEWSRSRELVYAVYRGAGLLARVGEVVVRGVALDSTTHTLYVTSTQLFSARFIPFHHAQVSVTTVFQLEKRSALESNSNSPPSSGDARDDEGGLAKYYIAAQNDLYQLDELLALVLPLGWVLAALWRLCGLVVCVMGAGVVWGVDGWAGRSGVKKVDKGEGGMDRKGEVSVRDFGARRWKGEGK